MGHHTTSSASYNYDTFIISLKYDRPDSQENILSSPSFAKKVAGYAGKVL